MPVLELITCIALMSSWITCRAQNAPASASEDTRPYVSFRLGGSVWKYPGLDLGLDFTAPGLSVARGVFTRFDGELLASPRVGSFLGLPGTTYAFAVDQIYLSGRGSGVRPYAGVGAGYYHSSSTGPGAKLILGAQFTPVLSAELNVHVTTNNGTLAGLMIRLSAP